MCQELNLSTTAEGVELEAQFSFLRRLGCDFAQGYLLSKPVTAEETAGLLSEARTMASSSSESA